MADSIKETLQLIVNRSGYDSVVNYDCSKLWFSFRYGGMMLEVECDEETEEKYNWRDSKDGKIHDNFGCGL